MTKRLRSKSSIKYVNSRSVILEKSASEEEKHGGGCAADLHLNKFRHLHASLNFDRRQRQADQIQDSEDEDDQIHD